MNLETRWAQLLRHLEGCQILAVSSGLDDTVPTRLEQQHRGAVEVLPLLSGRAVIPQARSETRFVLGWPNRLGRLEPGVDGQTVWLWEPDLAPEPPGESVACSRRGLDSTTEQQAGRVSLAVDLAKRLNQLRGVRHAWLPETPIVTVLLPVDPRLLDVDFPLEPVPPKVFGLPGGATIVIPSAASAATVAAYAADLTTALDRLAT